MKSSGTARTTASDRVRPDYDNEQTLEGQFGKRAEDVSLNDFHEYVVSRVKSPNNPKRNVEKVLYIAASIGSLLVINWGLHSLLYRVH